MKKKVIMIALLGGLPALQAETPEPPLPASEPQTAETQPTLPDEERHIRAGIVLMGMLQKTLSEVNDHRSAQAAVPIIVRLTRELQTWAQGVAALPPLSEDDKTMYEVRYLPTIRALNDHLRVQGERLAAADYYGSRDLSTALISLYCTTQQ